MQFSDENLKSAHQWRLEILVTDSNSNACCNVFSTKWIPQLWKPRINMLVPSTMDRLSAKSFWHIHNSPVIVIFSDLRLHTVSVYTYVTSHTSVLPVPLCHIILLALTAQSKMLSKTADFAPGAATWRTGRNTHGLWFRPTCSTIWKHDKILITEIKQCIALSSEEDRAMATGNIYRKFSKIWTRGFWDMQVDR